MSRFASFRTKYEKLLRSSPRTLEFACALGLIGLALEFLAEVVFAEWFYFTYHRDYAYTLASRTMEWIYGLCATLLALWMLGMAWTLLRRPADRVDRGLFSPGALRVWGAIFAVLPLFVIAASPHALAHVELVFWSVVVSGACFALAARRSGIRSGDGANPLESVRPID